MQMELFQTCPESPQPPRLWKDFPQEQRTIIVNLLARLMMKAIRQEAMDTHDE